MTWYFSGPRRIVPLVPEDGPSGRAQLHVFTSIVQVVLGPGHHLGRARVHAFAGIVQVVLGLSIITVYIQKIMPGPCFCANFCGKGPGNLFCSFCHAFSNPD